MRLRSRALSDVPRRGARWDYADPRFKRVQKIFGKKRPESHYEEARAILRLLIRENQHEGKCRGRKIRPLTPKESPQCSSE